MKNINRGFTLVELMIVIAIIGMLAAVGYPAYTDYVKKAQRADGIHALLAESGRLEEFYLNNDTYLGATVLSTTSPEGYYNITLTGNPGGALTAFGYVLTATRTPANDLECLTLTYDQLGVKDATGSDKDNCWK